MIGQGIIQRYRQRIKRHRSKNHTCSRGSLGDGKKRIKMRIVFFGPPGVGKGTQAHLLAQRLNVPLIATGDVLREAIASGSTLGLKAAEYVSKGELVPDDVMIALVKDLIERRAHDFVLDGFPRTVKQAEALKRALGEKGIDAVIGLCAPLDLLIERLSQRRVCPRCKRNYHLTLNPPKRTGRCDSCGSPLVQREDDRESVIKRRIEVYTKESQPLVEWYRGKGLLREVDGTGAVSQVFARVCGAVEIAQPRTPNRQSP